MNTETHRQIANDITSLHGQFEDVATRWVLFDKDGKAMSEIKALEADIVRLLGEVTP